jgi:histidinol-phosphate/aromatic aminotransferase/cobyric acid decarboxylase-like protein
MDTSIFEKEDGFIYLNINENDFEHHDDVLNMQISNSLLTKYYNKNYTNELIDLISKYINIDEKYILLMNGGDACLDSLIRLYKSIHIIEPTYGNYKVLANMYNVQETDLSISELCIICNPNNPDGLLYSTSFIQYLLEKYPEKTFIIDETYMDYLTLTSQSDSYSSISLVPIYHNLFIIRSFSKAFGLAGVRLSYVISSNVNLIKKQYNNKNVCDISKLYAINILKNIDHYKNQVINMYSNKEKIVNAFNKKKYNVIDTYCNFICIECDNVQEFISNAKKYKLIFRDISTRIYNHIRITIGNDTNTNEVLKYVNSLP